MVNPLKHRALEALNYAQATISCSIDLNATHEQYNMSKRNITIEQYHKSAGTYLLTYR